MTALRLRVSRWFARRWTCPRKGHALESREHFFGGRDSLKGRIMLITRCRRCGVTTETSTRRPRAVPRSRKPVRA